ncbi:MAG: carbohydrate ABC transporter permease [Atribacterota bacterium]|nr:carbohydrate ABC transporter permease [Atribacterota bacterium]MDD4895537.1 carbohydrate ABC transporter permease [Atribacterota bacterium]MDD5637166.1 carbohydrate ABC transporter permease [Atribacterota bacterium]
MQKKWQTKTKNSNISSIIINSFIWLFLIVTAAFILAPLVFMFAASVMPASDVMKMPFPWIPKGIYWQNYWQGIRGNDGSFIYIRNILNSFIVAGSVTVTTVILSAITGFGLAKYHFWGRNVVFMMIMATFMIPFEAIMIPLYLVVTKLGLQNSYQGLIIPFLVNAFGIFLMRQYFITFPDEILDAARIDGASEMMIFRTIIVPNSIPAMATLAVLTFKSQWDNLLWPLLIVQSEEMKTIPQYIVRFISEKHTDEGALMAVASIASIPILILFLRLSKYFIGGAALFSSRKG